MRHDWPDLHLLRHGETEWNLEERLQGRGDSALTERGMRQARWQAALMRGVGGARLSSPLGRADRTARIVFGPDYRHDDRLVEICVGRFAGQRLADLRRSHPPLFAGGPLDWYDRCPAGEGFAALHARCASFLDTLDGPATIVTHAITLRMIRLIVLDRPLSELACDPVHQGAVHRLSRGQETVLRHPDDAGVPQGLARHASGGP
ncbi:histidine phosphatase family protein [Paracoccus sp. ME4]|uniref:histidine phosphatase family protein n=1 Tax=Paracoccus sp. ME4 TaxID=3138066 RepID=UPI00398B5C3C